MALLFLMLRLSCTVCGKEFATKSKLNRHEKEHSMEKPFRCECGLSYKRLEHLKRHQLVHQESLPFECFSCEKTFISNYHLNRHLAKHEEKPDDKTPPQAVEFTCGQCSLSFTTKSLLSDHLKTHLICPICLKEFKTPKTLSNHSAIHNIARKLHSCTDCDKVFSTVLEFNSEIQSQ